MSTPSDSEDDISNQDPPKKNTNVTRSQSISPRDSISTSNVANSSGTDKPSTPRSQNTLPIQKRRRVTRACDECRRKKIKCDGKQPCTHCTVYSYGIFPKTMFYNKPLFAVKLQTSVMDSANFLTADCTYDQPSNRRRNPTPQYIEALETRLHRMEALLKVVLPDVDVNSPTFNLGKMPQLQKLLHENNRMNTNHKQQPPMETVSTSSDAVLESMVEAAGRLDIDESGHFDFHGHSSGLTFLNKLREQFGDLLGGSTNSLLKFNVLPNAPSNNAITSGPLDALKSPVHSPRESNHGPDNITLPKKAIAVKLINTCLNEACILLRFIHQPSFEAMFERLYDKDPDLYDNEEYRFLPLLYLALAVGCVFTSKPETLGFTNGTTEGLKYYLAGRRFIEITDCRDCTSIQRVLLMILFLQSSAKMATCYSYVAIALSASIRMGLHRKIPFPDPLESETRKRIFWTIRKIDIYVGTLLGLPKGIQDEDIDQELPLEVDDQYITRSGITRSAGEEPSSLAASNAHTKLMKILDKLVRKIYPIKGMQISNTGTSDGYLVSYTSVKEIEDDLAAWQKELPGYLWSGEGDVRFVRSRYLLRMAFAHVKMMLYRPFLHYVARPRNGRIRDERPYASAAECINICREIIHMCDEMNKKGFLTGAYWFNIYTTFFSVISLVYFVLENMSDSTAPVILREASLGRDCLMSLADQSVAAERCCTSLASLFDQLPAKLEVVYQNANETANKKKRTRGTSPMVSMPDVRSPEDAQMSASRDLNTFNSDSGNGGNGGNGESILGFAYQMPQNATPTSNISLQQHLGGTSGLPDLNALMFPASSAFAYGNQAMKLDQSNQFANIDPSLSSPNPMYNHNGTSYNASSSIGLPQGSPFDILEGQFSGSLPTYTYQGQPNEQQLDRDVVSMQTGFGSQDDMGFPAYASNGPFRLNNYPVNLDELFNTGLEETQWDDLLSQNPTRI